MARKRNFVKVEAVKIPWYRIGNRTFIDGRKYQRRLQTFTDHSEALAQAEALATEIHNGGAEATAFTARDRAIYAQALAQVQTFGVELPAALLEWSEARTASTGHKLSEVVAAGVKALTRLVHPTMDVALQLIASKRGHDLDGRYERDVRRHLQEFAAAFPGDIARISTAEIEQWLNERKKHNGELLGTVRRNHVLDDIVHLFKFARSRGFLPDKITAAQQIKKVKSHAQTIQLFTPAELQTLLSHVDHEWLPLMAISALSGVRTEEIGLSYHAADRKEPLRWEDFDWASREIIVSARCAKTGKPRRCPIVDNLWQWLKPWREEKATGPVIQGSIDKFRKRFKRQLLKLSHETEISPRLIEWPHNALRHSYGSYRMAILKNANQLWLEMGNSLAMIQNHYHNPRSEQEAKQWFSIFPTTAENIIQLSLQLTPGRNKT